MLVRDHFAALVTLTFATAVFFAAGALPAPAALFPRAVAVVMILSAIVVGVRATLVARPAAEPEFDTGATIRIGAVIGLSILYVAGVRWLGYVTASLVFIPVTGWFLGVRRPVLLLVTTALFVGAVAYVFRKIFSIPLPRETLLALLS